MSYHCWSSQSTADAMQHCTMECRLQTSGKRGGGHILDVDFNEHKLERQDWFIWFKRWPLERSTSFSEPRRSDDGKNVVIYRQTLHQIAILHTTWFVN